MPLDAEALLDLADWRRRVAELYAGIRVDPDPERAWARWREVRDELVGTHPQSPISTHARERFEGLSYYPYDPVWRTTGRIEPAEPVVVDVGTSDGGTERFRRFGTVAFVLSGEACSLELFWLEGYAGGLYLSFRDETSGATTYGGGRYLLDTSKGADLGVEGGALLLDFNFAYQPSCSYDAAWSCPLPPPANRLPIAVAAGERLR